AKADGDLLSLNLKQGASEQILKSGFSYRKTVSLKPGYYHARIAVREEGTARLGSAASWVEIPDLSKKQLTLSSIFLSVGDDNRAPQNTTSDDNSGNKEDRSRPRPSTAKKIFKRGSKVDFLVFTYNARAEKGSPDVVIQSQVYSGSKLIYASPLAKM